MQVSYVKQLQGRSLCKLSYGEGDIKIYAVPPNIAVSREAIEREGKLVSVKEKGGCYRTPEGQKDGDASLYNLLPALQPAPPEEPAPKPIATYQSYPIYPANQKYQTPHTFRDVPCHKCGEGIKMVTRAITDAKGKIVKLSSNVPVDGLAKCVGAGRSPKWECASCLGVVPPKEEPEVKKAPKEPAKTPAPKQKVQQKQEVPPQAPNLTQDETLASPLAPTLHQFDAAMHSAAILSDMEEASVSENPIFTDDFVRGVTWLACRFMKRIMDGGK